MGWDPFHFTFRPDQTFVIDIMVSYWKKFLVKTNFAILQKVYPCKLLGNFITILSIPGYKNLSDLIFPPDILVSYVVFEICLVFIISLWKFGLVAYGLRSLSVWGFTFGFDQTFVKEIVLSYS